MEKFIYSISAQGDACMYQLDDIETDKHRGTLRLSYYENDGTWTENVRGKEAVEVVDTGNNIKVSFRGDSKRKPLILDYSEVEQLYLMLSYHWKKNNTDTIINKFKEVDE